MKNISSLLERLSESATLAMSRKSRELKENGIDVISLSLGEPDFNTPDFIKNAAKEALENNITKYPPVNGFKELREAISRKFERDNDLHYSPDQIVVSTGAKQSIINVILSMIGPGDRVIIPAPYWVSYIEQVKIADGDPVIVNAGIESDFKITPSQLNHAIDAQTKLMVFSSPCNPSGSVYSRDELEALAEVIKGHPQLYVICDEIYEYINFKGKHQSLGQFKEISERIITVNGVSKGFAMTGWRIGYMGAPLWLAKACTKIQGQITSGANSIAQMAALEAIKADPSVTIEMKDAFQKRKGLVTNLLKQIPGIKLNDPDGAFYHFPDISYYFGKSHDDVVINDASDLCEYLLEHSHVALVTGDAFGSPNNIRISYAASENELQEALNRVKNALAKLK